MKTTENKTVEVRVISYDDTKPFLLHVHYARRMPSIIHAFGLFVDGELQGVVTYGEPASPSLCKGIAGEEHKKDVLELNRLAILPSAPKNAASELIGKSLKMLPHKMFIVSYADWGGWGHVGYVYQATNWLYTGMTHPRTDIFAGVGKHSRHYSENDGKRQLRTAKYRYVFITGSGKEKKKLLKELKYPTMEYPKNDSRRYDIDDPEPKTDIYAISGEEKNQKPKLKETQLWS